MTDNELKPDELTDDPGPVPAEQAPPIAAVMAAVGEALIETGPEPEEEPA
jgi:hypothetical protein